MPPISPNEDAAARQHGEPARAFHAFCHYRDDFGSDRSLDKAWRRHMDKCQHQPQKDHKRTTKRWAAWSVQWDWIARVEAADRALDAAKQKAFRVEQLAATARHARMCIAASNMVAVNLRVALEAGQDPTTMAMMIANAKATPAGFRGAQTAAQFAAKELPALVVCERLILGLTTQTVELRDAARDNFADAITASPAATAAAIALLDALANTSSSAKDLEYPAV